MLLETVAHNAETLGSQSVRRRTTISRCSAQQICFVCGTEACLPVPFQAKRVFYTSFSAH